MWPLTTTKPEPSPTLQAAEGMVKALQQELLEAATVLDAVAHKLKNIQGQGYAASQVKQAAMKARQAAGQP